MSEMKRDFESKVLRKVRSFREEPLGDLLAEAVCERQAWLRHSNRRGKRMWTPREAYELFLIDYLGLARESVPIVSENSDEIVWDSVNDCPTLGACRQLGLDTRRICRRVYEKSTQAFLSRLDPQLRFWRSYEHIRPHASSCREAIFKIEFDTMMRFAIEEANAARREGNRGSGAAVVFCREVIATGHAGAQTESAFNTHAEIQVIRKAQRVFGDSDLCGGILFVTSEPCARCLRLATEVNLTTIVFGAFEEDIAAVGMRGDRSKYDMDGMSNANWVEILGGVVREECTAIHLGR